MTETFLNGRVTLHSGNCLDVLATLEENSIDSVVTDPPYHLTSIVKRFGAENAAPAQSGKTGAYKRASAGFMGKQWDGGEIAFEPETWAAVMRVLKPGGHLLAFGAPKNFGFMQTAIAQAGFEVRDVLCWLFGSGFPKSHDVSKGIDRAAGAEREVVGSKLGLPGYAETTTTGRMMPGQDRGGSQGYLDVTAPATDAAKQWEGWGTALKPAYEPIILARKPLSESTIAANVLRWGTGALNIDGCRVAGGMDDTPESWAAKGAGGKAGANGFAGQFSAEMKAAYARGEMKLPTGRWPANVLHDGSDEVVGAFPETESGAGNKANRKPLGRDSQVIATIDTGEIWTGDSGSAARFFYTAKADSDDRLGSKHPTVKPLDLIEYLEVLVTPPGGTILDPFAGTGTAGEAAFRRGFNAILIEREEEYCNDIRRRMALCMSGPDERQRESIKARTKDKPVDHGPLFGAAMTAPPAPTEGR